MSDVLRHIAHQLDCSDTFNRPGVRENDACWSANGCQPWFLQNDILRDIVRDGLRESGWRPIETAPKDDTEILTWCDGTFRVAVYAWDDMWQPEGLPAMRPTHWMPLPYPPKTNSEGEG